MNSIVQESLMPKHNINSKKGQDPNSAENYWLISLLNNDYKLFSIILAEKLKNIL